MSGPRNNAENELSSSLQRQADEFARRGGHDLDLAQVVSRAGEIRRGRRMRASMVMAAVVLAVAVPVGITVIGNDNPTSPKPGPLATTSPTPDNSPILLADLPEGAPPKLGLIRDGFYEHTPMVRISGPNADAISAVATDKGLMLTAGDDRGNTTVRYFSPTDQTQTRTWPIDGGVAVSPEGNVAAFVQPDGTVTVVQDDGSLTFDLGKVPSEGGYNAIRVDGENCSGRSAETTCSVLVETVGVVQQTWEFAPNREPKRVYPAFQKLVGVSVQGLAAGFTSYPDDGGSCSQVRGKDDSLLWETCKYKFLGFSPGGDYLLATNADGDGFGDTRLVVLDSRTGEPALDLPTGAGASIPSMQWEDDSHVLAVVSDQVIWSVQRIALDGNRTSAEPQQQAQGDSLSPFVMVR